MTYTHSGLRWLQQPEPEESDYGWIITKDHIPFDDEPEGTTLNAKGVIGPHNVPDWMITLLQSSKHGKKFQIRDDDNEKYYNGRYIGPDDETMFAPLWDFGAPNSGATSIFYKNEEGKWELL